MSAYVQAQYEALPQADSITVDPHKGGYVPYPAGALCYRNAALRDAISLQAPVVFHSQTEPTVGIYGVEGSPSPAPPPPPSGSRTASSARTAAAMAASSANACGRPSACSAAWRRSKTPASRSPSSTAPPPNAPARPAQALAAERALLRRFVRAGQRRAAGPAGRRPGRARACSASSARTRSSWPSRSTPAAPDGTPNPDLARANALNERVFSLCSVIEPRADLEEVELILTSSRFDPAVYGQSFVDRFCRRMGVVPPPGAAWIS